MLYRFPAGVVLAVALVATASANNVDYVDPLIGTDPVFPGNGNYAGMIPTTGSPFAMTRWTPMTLENTVGTCPYHYTDTVFYGFLATHQPAQWMGESGEIAVSAGTGDVKPAFKDRGLTFSHDEEVSTPQYYKTVLHAPPSDGESEGDIITAELTAVSRSGSMRFTFDPSSSKSRYVVVQATRDGIEGQVTIDAVNREIAGFNPERQDDVLGPFTADDFKGYFVARFDTDFDSWGTANSDTLSEGSSEGSGSAVSGYVRFPMSTSVVNVRVGVSYISIEQARQNLEVETPMTQTLEETAAVVKQQWADKLDLVEIDNATDDELAIFYTAMYHALQYPSEMTEYNASGSFYYSGFDNTVHAGEAYTGYSIWDTFRAEWGFLNLFAPERIDGMIQSMLQTFEQGGRLPIWQNIVETNIMIGTHSSSLIAESMSKGFRGFDLDVMWRAIWKDAMVPPEDDLDTVYFDRQQGTGCEARAGLTREFKLGYVAAELTSEAGSRTLEYAYDDYTVAVIANLTGRAVEAAHFLERSRNYRNIFNNETMFMEARNEDGSWNPGPNTWTEATKWVYTFNVQHDFPGLRELFHGAEGLGDKLDQYYECCNDQTNEPSHATVYAYLYANQPAKAQTTIRSLLLDNYFNTPVGLSGNDDCGQMSSWYIFNALGFYPMNPASGEYMVGAPLFDRVRMRLPAPPVYDTDLSSSGASDRVGTVLTITAEGARDKPYVQALSVDGRSYDAPVLRHAELMTATEIAFEMSAEPQTWGANTL